MNRFVIADLKLWIGCYTREAAYVCTTPSGCRHSRVHLHEEGKP